MNSFDCPCKRCLSILLIASTLVIITAISLNSSVTIIPNSYGQIGSMATLQNTPGTYVVRLSQERRREIVHITITHLQLMFLLEQL